MGRCTECSSCTSVLPFATLLQFPPGPALVVPYEYGKLVYNITLQLPQLPCNASPSCVDYIGSICQQQGVGFYYQLRMTQDSGEPNPCRPAWCKLLIRQQTMVVYDLNSSSFCTCAWGLGLDHF